MHTPSAQPTQQPTRLSRADRRAAIRFDCSLEAYCVSLNEELRSATFQTRIHDISKTGVALRLDRPIPLGAHLVMEIELGEGVLSRPLQAHVVHCQSESDSDWIIGCEFVTPLSINELIMLV